MKDPNIGQGQPSANTADAVSPNDAHAGFDHAGSTLTKDTVVDAADGASSLAEQVKDKALAVAADQKEGLADRVDDLAHAVHKSGEQFAGQQDWIAGAIERGAAELGSFARSLRENDLGSLLDQVKSVAKRQPALFVGVSLAAGFAIARLGKLVVADVSGDDLPMIPEVGHGRR